MARPDRSILIIGALVLALVVAAIVAALAFGQDRASSFAANSPERALQDYLAAIDGGDVDRAYDLLSRNAQNQIPKEGAGGKDAFSRFVSNFGNQSSSRRIRIERVDQSAGGDVATITIAIDDFSGSGIDFNRSTWTRPVRMVREDGAWKVDDPYFYGAMPARSFALAEG